VKRAAPNKQFGSLERNDSGEDYTACRYNNALYRQSGRPQKKAQICGGFSGVERDRSHNRCGAHEVPPKSSEGVVLALAEVEHGEAEKKEKAGEGKGEAEEHHRCAGDHIPRSHDGSGPMWPRPRGYPEIKCAMWNTGKENEQEGAPLSPPRTAKEECALKEKEPQDEARRDPGPGGFPDRRGGGGSLPRCRRGHGGVRR